MLENLSGATRVYFIIGHPMAQVKSPNGVTRTFEARGRDAILVPVHVLPEDVGTFIDAVARTRNVDGLIVTVPHKFAAQRHCATLSERAQLLTSVNVLRRNADQSWHGDMVDGAAFVGGLRNAGCAPAGKRALLVGAGGAGSAIGLELLDAGVSRLAVHDGDVQRRDALIARLEQRHPGKATAGSADPTGHDVIANATPAGMRADDALPVDVTKLRPTMFVGDVVTVPEVTPLLAAARDLGCRTSTGVDMFKVVNGLMVDFFMPSSS